ncbi:hypothetical protein ACFY2R_10275 [Micromonospora olivasterospora]|uniref:Uncharacterized protein n=1 Tax=Micromonospora olivasterospora TaxID=1880 RepID=A0A562I8U8_MICOL|nr:hypothetical protein [Micromonospora olivasterospora]TWH67460.1 hypothetical protein JD77_02435 [Micromonospora olivasterospora]
MTAGGFREVDHDLLADYLGGALDGTPDEALVARLVEQDPAWAHARDALAPAVARVSDDLAAWALPAPEMPLAVADRIAAALAGAGPAAAGDENPDMVDGTGRAAAADGTDEADRPAGRGAPATVPAQPGSRRAPGGTRPTAGRAAGTGPGRRPRRWARLAGPVALAAASVVAVGFGMNQLVRTGAREDASTLSERAGAANAGPPFHTTVAPLHSGADWTPEALTGGPLTMAGPTGSFSPGPDPKAPPAGDVGGRLPAVGGLDRIVGQDALAACLAAVSAEHGAGPITVDLVDYARFQGAPALVVRFVDPARERWAWVSGPECGIPGSGADTRYHTRVG